MLPVVLLVPGRLDTRTGGYEYDRRMISGLRARGWEVEVRELDASFPTPAPAALEHAARVFAAIPARTTVIVDGLALGAMPAQIEGEAGRLNIVALVHLPLAAEVGLDRDTAARFEASERRALAAARFVIVTGRSQIAALAKYGVARERLAVVEPGTDPAPLARGGGGSPAQLLSVGTLTPRKGYEVLVHALAKVPHRDWRLVCAGSLDRDPGTVERVRTALAKEGLDDRVSLAGELDGAALGDCYDRADLFVLATLHETFGMAVAEALARGLPVVSTTTGAIPDLVGTAAGILVPPGDARALAAALTRVVGNAHERDRLAEGARSVRRQLPTWDEASARLAAVLERVAIDG